MARRDAQADRTGVGGTPDEALASRLLANLPGVTVLAFDHDLVYTMATGAALAQHGWKSELMVGRAIAEVLPADLYAELKPHYRAALRGEEQSFRFESRDGTHTYRVQIAPLRDEDGKTARGNIVSRDITPVIAAELELRESRQTLQDVLDGLNVPVAVKDEARRFMFVNCEYERLQRLRRGDLTGKTVFDLYPPDVAQMLDEDDQEVLSSGGVIRNERDLPQADGSQRT